MSETQTRNLRGERSGEIPVLSFLTLKEAKESLQKFLSFSLPQFLHMQTEDNI